MQPKKIVALCGSLRAQSLNRKALLLAQSTMAADLAGSMVLDILEWRDVPVLDADALTQGFPPSVHYLRERIRAADGVLIATPEYNFSIPGGLKNTLDWLSRGDDQPFRGKPVAIMSATPGPVGGARVQYDLRRVLLFVDAMVLVKPEVFIAHAAAKFGEDDRCTDPQTQAFVLAQMQAFGRWMDAVSSMQR